MMEIKHKTRIGRVVSNKMDKTAVVAVETAKHHRLYKKTIKKMVKYKAHDVKNECGEWYILRIIETRPLSMQKRWRVAEIITKKEVVAVKAGEIV